MKQKLKTVGELFNAKPLKIEWMQSALEMGLIQYSSDYIGNGESNKIDVAAYDPTSVAEFLKSTSTLGKAQIGEFISKGPADMYPYHAKVLKEYVMTFIFEGIYRTALNFTLYLKAQLSVT